MTIPFASSGTKKAALILLKKLLPKQLYLYYIILWKCAVVSSVQVCHKNVEIIQQNKIICKGKLNNASKNYSRQHLRPSAGNSL